jgi:6-phosphogluconolactonase (cycloisomerase 2 family)
MVTCGQEAPSLQNLFIIASSITVMLKSPALTVIDPYGRFLYVAEQAANSIYAFQISPTNGSLTAVSGSPFTTNLNG